MKTVLRVIHTGDWHVEEKAEFSRLDDLSRVIETGLVPFARDFKPDVIINTGDLFDKRPTANEYVAARDLLRRCREVAPQIVIQGNHDVYNAVELYSTAGPDRNPIMVAQRPHIFALGNADIICLPWFSKSHLVAQLPPNLSAEETSVRVLDVARNLLTVQRAYAAESRARGRIPVLATHILVSGSQVSSGQTLQGITVGLNPYDLNEVGAAYVALGHIHKRQEWFEGRISYSGSPVRQDFGEPETKGFNAVEIEMYGERVTVRNEFIELPARRIERLEADFTNRQCPIDIEQWIKSQSWDVRDAWVRFRYRIDKKDEHRVDRTAIERLFLGAGAYEVQIEPVKEENVKIRCEEIVTLETDWQKVQAFWKTKGFELSHDQLRRLEIEFAALEEEEAAGLAA
jgi:exonuclease SbcD